MEDVLTITWPRCCGHDSHAASAAGWVEVCSHANAFDAYIDARRRCVLRGCPYLLVDAETGGTVSVLTVKQCLHQYGVDGDFSG